MNKFIHPNPKTSVLANEVVEGLRSIIRNLVKLQYETGKTKIDQKGDGFDYVVWLSILSFMTRKICSLYLGHTDYDYEFKDIKFSLTKNDKIEN